MLQQVPGPSDFPMGTWLPRVDIEREFPFLPAEPKKLIREKQFNSVPLITGIAVHELSSLMTCKMFTFILFISKCKKKIRS